MSKGEELTSVFAALADPTRRAILAHLAQGPARVGEIRALFTISAPAISQHLKVLENAGLITRTVEAQWRTLSLEPEPLAEASAWIAKQRQEWNMRLDALADHLEVMKNRPENTNNSEEKKP